MGYGEGEGSGRLLAIVEGVCDGEGKGSGGLLASVEGVSGGVLLCRYAPRCSGGGLQWRVQEKCKAVMYFHYTVRAMGRKGCEIFDFL